MTVDRKIAAAALRDLRKQGLKINLGANVTATKVIDNKVIVNYQDNHDESQQLTVDKLVVAVGRKPNSDNLDCAKIGIATDEYGFIQIDKHYQTAVPGIYAIGDVVGGPMLAHKGSEEGMVLAEQLAGQNSKISYTTIPWVIYIWPEIAWVGRTERQLETDEIEYKVGTFPFVANGRARAQGDTSGMVRIIADVHTDRILGVHIYGISASELIAEAVTAMEFEASAEDLARTIHAHPTLSEALHEAALDVDERMIHA